MRRGPHRCIPATPTGPSAVLYVSAEALVVEADQLAMQGEHERAASKYLEARDAVYRRRAVRARPGPGPAL